MKLEEYLRELWLMERQYGQEEELYPLINMLLREGDNTKHLSIRDVHNGSLAKDYYGKKMLQGAGSFPDIAILDEKFSGKKEEKNQEANKIENRKRIYGCVEAKALNAKLVQDIEDTNSFPSKLTIKKMDILEISDTIGRYKYKLVCKFPEKGVYLINNDEQKDSKKYTLVCENEEKEKAKNENKKFFKEAREITNIASIKEKLGCIDANWIPINSNKQLNASLKGHDLQLGKYKYLKILSDRYIAYDSKEMIQEYLDDQQLLGELLYFRKVIYTNGIKWYFIELNTVPSTGRNKVENNEKKTIAELREKLETGDFNEITVNVNCTEIGNLSTLYKECIKDEEINNIHNKIKLDDLKEWARLKANLSIINWIGETNHSIFIKGSQNEETKDNHN